MGRLRSRQLNPLDRKTHQLHRLASVIDDDKAENHRSACSPPRRRVHEQWFPHQIARQTTDDLDRIVISANLDVPGFRTTWPREFGP
jgi:hypothetical protein